MAITPGDIRARFQLALDTLYELEFADKEGFDEYNKKHKIGPKTIVTIGDKKMQAGAPTRLHRQTKNIFYQHFDKIR